MREPLSFSIKEDAMQMSMSQRLRQTQKLAQSLRLSQQLRLQVQEMALSIRIALISALRDDNYEPRGDCPHCGRKMTPLEIIRGFNNDPNDYTTCCTGCKHRFEPVMVAGPSYSRVQIPFYCATQTLEQMRSLDTSLAPDDFRKRHPAVYHSAVFHHGGLKGAFQKIGMEYPFEEIPDWKRKVGGFLGRLPDTVIAECVNVPVRVIRSLRKELKISAYNVRKTLTEVATQPA